MSGFRVYGYEDNKTAEQVILDFLEGGKPVKVQSIVDKCRGMGHAVKMLILLDLYDRDLIEFNLHAKTVTLIEGLELT